MMRIGPAIMLACSAAPLFAQVAPPAAGSTLSLSAEERQDVLDHNTETSAQIARDGPGHGPAGSRIHGEVGAMIGSNGARGAYGDAVIPLGENAAAGVSFESSRFGRRR